MARNTTHIKQNKKKEKEEKTAARNRRRINAVDIHDFTLDPTMTRKRTGVQQSLFFSLYHVRNVKRNKANPLSLYFSSF
jgi:hypothetical protein